MCKEEEYCMKYDFMTNASEPNLITKSKKIHPLVQVYHLVVMLVLQLTMYKYSKFHKREGAKFNLSPSDLTHFHFATLYFKKVALHYLTVLSLFSPRIYTVK